MNKLNVRRDLIAQTLQSFRPQVPPNVGAGIDDALKILAVDTRDPLQLGAAVESLKKTVEAARALPEAAAPLLDALQELERGISDALSAYYRVQSKLVKLATGGSRSVLLWGIVVLVAIVLVGAGIPITMNIIKNRAKGATAALSSLSAQLVPDMGYDLSSVGGYYTLNTSQAAYAKTNDVCTYTVVMNISSLENSPTSDHVLFARGNGGNSPSAEVMRVRLDDKVNTGYIDFAQTGASSWCTYTIQDVPMYRWFVMHIVYNNTAAYKIAQVYIDGSLVNLCHLFLCPQALVSHDGDTVIFGQEQPKSGGAGTTMTNVAYKYYKYASYTMQPDEIAGEASSLLSQIQAQLKQQQKQMSSCST